MKLRCRKISSRTSGLRRASGRNKTTPVELDASLLSDESSEHEAAFVEVFESLDEVSAELSFVSSEVPLLAIIPPKGLTQPPRRAYSLNIQHHYIGIVKTIP